MRLYFLFPHLANIIQRYKRNHPEKKQRIVAVSSRAFVFLFPQCGEQKFAQFSPPPVHYFASMVRVLTSGQDYTLSLDAIDEATIKKKVW